MNEALLSRFQPTTTARTIYVRGVCEDAGELTNRGYTVVDLDTVEDRSEWLLGALQGVLDGTVDMGKQAIEALELEMKSRGLIDARRVTVNIDLKKKGDVRDLLAWGESRHTLQGNTVLMDPSKIRAHSAEAARRKPMAQRKARGSIRKDRSK